MKVLHTVHNFLPEARGGTETYVFELLKMQERLGIEPVVFCGRNEGGESEEIHEIEYEGIRIYRYVHEKRDTYPLDGNFPRGIEFYERVLEKEKPDIVHVEHWFNLTSRLVDIARDRSIPAFVTINDYYSTCPLFFRLPDHVNFCEMDIPPEDCVKCLARYKEIKREDVTGRFHVFAGELKKAERVFVVSKSLKNMLEAAPWFRGMRFTLLPLPRPEMKGANGPPINVINGSWDLKIATWGGLVRGKGLGTIVEACLETGKEKAVLVHHWGNIIDKELKEELQEKAAGGGLHLEFKGEFDKNDIPRLMGGYDVAVFPSFFHETHGFTVDEAMAVGLPVIVSDRGAPKERIGKRGLAIRAGDHQTLSRIFKGFMEDKGFLESLKKEPPMPQPTMETHAKELLDFYTAST